jgi:hypothetical protein
VEGWNDFCVAEAGASAALAGLIFVGVSINLNRLIDIPAVLMRSAATIRLMLGVLCIASIVLIPDQSIRTVWWEALLVGVILWLLTTGDGIRRVQRIDAKCRLNAVIAGITRQCAMIPIIVGTILLITHNDTGMKWIAGAFILSLIVAINEAWVVLVELAR